MTNQLDTEAEDFEKWIRMATDNKINASNSWNVALIDYFHDLRLLREGDGINFQKASATLDGCVKIYSSRVDSAATETGRLLSGLSASKRGESQGENEHESEEDEEDEERQKKTKPRNRKLEPTLYEDFEKKLRLSKMEREVHVDPLFKKVLTDFDEGGAKSLLLNLLNVDDQVKIIFDTTKIDGAAPEEGVESHNDKETASDIEDSDDEIEATPEPRVLNFFDDDEDVSFIGGPIDIMGLQSKFFPDLDSLQEFEICPSMADIKAIINDGTTANDLLHTINNLEEEEEHMAHAPINAAHSGNGSFGDFGDDFGGDDMGPDAPVDHSVLFDEEENQSLIGLSMRNLFNESAHDDSMADADNNAAPDEDLLSYFDKTAGKAWAGPVHWKVQRLLKMPTYNKSTILEQAEQKDTVEAPVVKPTPKKKELKTIDFMSQEFPDELTLFQESASTYLPKHSWFAEDKNLLPDDMQFTTKRFIKLFLKDQMLNAAFSKKAKLAEQPLDENVWADLQNIEPDEMTPAPMDDYDGGDVGGFDDYGEYDFPVAQSQTSVSLKSMEKPIKYSRVAKKVDVKALKDNLWTSLQNSAAESPEESTTVKVEDTDNAGVIKFSDVVKNLDTMYTPEVKKDISTSFCFICMLHLANEHGLTIENNDEMTDLKIIK